LSLHCCWAFVGGRFLFVPQLSDSVLAVR